MDVQLLELLSSCCRCCPQLLSLGCSVVVPPVVVQLASISGEDVIFDITKGDDKEQSDTINKNKDLFRDSRSIFLWTNGQASLIAAGIFEWLKP